MRSAALIAAVIAAVCTAPAAADRIILAPTGTVLARGEIRAEGAISPSHDDAKIYWLGMGLQRLEINGTRFDDGAKVTGSGKSDAFGAEFSLLPETTLTPGIGIGATDISNETPEGRGYYLALSKAIPLTGQIPTPIRDVRVHAGFGVSGIDGVFAGAEASIPFGLRVYAEYFRKDFNFAVGWRVLPGLQVKAYLLDGQTFYGLQFSPPL